MIFSWKIHWKSFLLKELIRNNFYYKNNSEMIFTIKCIGNYFHYYSGQNYGSRTLRRCYLVCFYGFFLKFHLAVNKQITDKS